MAPDFIIERDSYKVYCLKVTKDKAETKEEKNEAQKFIEITSDFQLSLALKNLFEIQISDKNHFSREKEEAFMHSCILAVRTCQYLRLTGLIK